MTGARYEAGGGPSGRGWSLVEDWRCKYKYACRHALDMPDEDKDALVRGDLFHRAMAGHNEACRLASIGQNPMQVYGIGETISRVSRREGGLYPSWADIVSAAAYDTARWQSERGWEVLDVENYAEMWLDSEGRWVDEPPNAQEIRDRCLHQPMQAQPGPVYLHTMRYDVVVRNSQRRVLGLDYKTMLAGSKSKAEANGRAYSGSGQLQLMNELAARTFEERYGGTFGGLWVKLALLKPFSDGRFWHPPLMPVKASPGAVHRAARHRVAFEQELDMYLKAWEPADWPGVMSTQGPCHDRYGRCPFFEPCKEGWIPNPVAP